METAEEFARRIERQADDCECVECIRPLIEADRNATRLALLEEIRQDIERLASEAGPMQTTCAYYYMRSFMLAETKYRAEAQPVQTEEKR